MHTTSHKQPQHQPLSKSPISNHNKIYNPYPLRLHDIAPLNAQPLRPPQGLIRPLPTPDHNQRQRIPAQQALAGPLWLIQQWTDQLVFFHPTLPFLLRGRRRRRRRRRHALPRHVGQRHIIRNHDDELEGVWGGSEGGDIGELGGEGAAAALEEEDLVGSRGGEGEFVVAEGVSGVDAGPV